jgi:hypothetical protein
VLGPSFFLLTEKMFRWAGGRVGFATFVHVFRR